MKKYYAADNDYGNSTSVGFSNTWNVYVFDSKKARNAWVEENENTDMSVRKINKREIGDYIDRPKPFSGQCWVVAPYLGLTDGISDDPEGYIGMVICEYPEYNSARVNG